MIRAVCALAIVLAAARAQAPDLAAKSARAKQAMDAGRFDQAATLYRELVRSMPADPGMRMNLALALHSSGHYREAIANLRLVLKQSPAATPAWLVIGLGHLKLGEPAQAIAPLETFLKAEPNHAGARLELADAYLEAGRAWDAAEQFRRMTELDPSYAKAWQGLGLSYVAMSQRAFHALEAAAPASPQRLLLLARSAAERGQTRSAMRLYRDALAKAPNLRFAHAGLAETYRNTAHPDWALAEEERERRLPAPDCTSAKFECDFLAGRYEQVLANARSLQTAETFYWQSLACSKLAGQSFARLASLPPSSAVHELLAEAARIQRNYALAIQQWREALKFAPGDRRLQKGLARALWLNRDYESARPLLEKLIALEPESAELNLELGDTLLAESPEKAIPYLKTALRLEPGHLGAHASLGRAYMSLGRAELAIPHLKAALGLDTDGKMYYQLAQAYQKAGQESLARAALAKYRTISDASRASRPSLDEDDRPQTRDSILKPNF